MAHIRKQLNRPTHYNVKYTKNKISPMFLVSKKNISFIKYLSNYYNISMSKALNLAIFFYKFRLKGKKDAYKKASRFIRRKKGTKILYKSQ